MTNKEIRALSDDELIEMIANNERSLNNLKYSHAVSPIENPLQIREERKLIAQLKTDLQRRTQEQVEKKIDAGELSKENVGEFLQKNHNKFPSPLNKRMLNKIIGRKNTVA